MKKIVNWTFGSIFRTFGRIIAYLLIGFIFTFILSKSGLKISNLLGFMHVSAATDIGSNSGYSVLLCERGTNKCTSTTSSGKLPYGTSTSDASMVINGVVAQTNNLIYYTYQSGYTYNISFRTHFGGLGNKINLIKNDLSDWRFYIAGYVNDNVGFSDSYVQSASCSTRFDNTTSNGFITTCSIGVNANLSRIRIETYFWDRDVWVPNAFSNSWGSITSVRTDFIDITASQGVDATINNSTNNIINNQNQNTQDVINNQNQNTQQIIDSQNELLGQKCKNIFDEDNNQIVLGVVTNTSIGTSTTRLATSDFIKVKPNTTYTISFNSSNNINNINISSFTSNSFPRSSESGWIDNFTFTTDSLTNYIMITFRKSNNDELNTNNISNIMIVEGSTSKTYCKYGSYSSKLDDVSSSVNNLEDSILDDNVSDSDIEDKLDYGISNNSQGPFASFLTLPITWIQTLLVDSNVCRPLHIPLPFLENKYLDLPCMDEFWESLGNLEFIVYLVWYAVIGVRVFHGLFLLVVETTSAHDNDDYLTKIKSWEL